MRYLIPEVRTFFKNELFGLFRSSSKKGNAEDLYTFMEVSKARENSDFIRIIPSVILLLLVEICGLIFNFLSSAKTIYFYQYLSTCVSSFIICVFFCIFINHVLSFKEPIPNIKKISILVYWLFHLTSTLSFSTCEMFDTGTAINYFMFLIIFVFVPLTKPIYKLPFFFVSATVECIILVHTNGSIKLLAAIVGISLLSFVVSSIIYSSYVTSHISQARLEHLAEIDPLTGLLNRRGLYRNIDFLLPYYNRQDVNLMVIMCDIDFFKDYNDTFGHSEGDICIKLIADCIKNSFSRKADITARYGGEEFIIIVGGKPSDNAVKHLLNLLENIQDLNIESGHKEASKFVTLSIGAYETTTSDGKIDFNCLIKKADEELYKAKSNGRNCLSFNGITYRYI